MAFRFAIIGGGLTATSMLCQLIDRLAAMGKPGRPLCRVLEIALYEKEAHFGPGLPYSRRNVLPLHITNMCAQDMGVRADKPGDFFRWLLDNRERVQRICAELRLSVPEFEHTKPCCHYPRALVGAYLESRFAEAVATAAKLGVSIRLYPRSEVLDLYPEQARLALVVDCSRAPSEEKKHHADALLLATGHWSEQPPAATYFTSPWPAALLRDAIPPSSDVAIIGASLSAIETALTLSSDGNFLREPSGRLVFQPAQASRQLTLYSRRGLLPRVRGRRRKRPNMHLTCGKLSELIEAHPESLEISMLLDLFNREVRAAYGPNVDWRRIVQPYADAGQLLRHDIETVKKGDPSGELIWQSILAKVLPMARQVYLNLAPAERRRFERDHATVFFMHVATQPLENAEKLLALMEAGVVALVKAGDRYRVAPAAQSSGYLIRYRDAGGRERCGRCQYVVNATGQPRSIRSDPSPLAQNLVKKFLPRRRQCAGQPLHRPDLEAERNLTIDPATHQLMLPEAVDDSWSRLPLFAVGPMVRDQIIDTSMAWGLSTSTAQVADRILALLTEHINSERRLFSA